MPQPFDPERLLHWPIAPVTQHYGVRDTILYALGAGAGLDEDLRFTYEEGLQALPTMAAVLACPPFWLQDPATGIVWQKVLHGEQRLSLHAPLPTAGRVVAREKVSALFDKGADKGSIMVLERSLRDETGDQLLATLETTVVLRGNGGFGGSSEGARKPHPLPVDRPADLQLDLATRPEQALLYRLSGDYNPLHADPKVATAAGFAKPILHGLCAYALAGRALLKLLCGNDAARLRQLDVRFVSPVYPGETLRTEVWLESAGRAAFRVSVVERGVVALNNGYAEYIPS